MSTSGAVPGSVQPANLLPMLEKLTPYLKLATTAVDKMGPVVSKTWAYLNRLWVVMEPYRPQEFVSLVIGLVMVYCGGYYPMLIATVEAFRVCGYHRVRDCLIQLYNSYQIAREASRKDDLVDDNGDNIPDVLQIDSKQLLTRKIGVVLRAVDPALVNDAITGVAAGCFGVLATLKVQMAYTMTLGISIADVFRKAAEGLLVDPLHAVVPKEYHKWIPVGLSWATRSIAMFIAYMVQKIISAAHSALRGAQIIVRSAVKILVRKGILPEPIEEGSFVFTAAAMVIAASGFVSQLRNGFGVPIPFPFSILLWPLDIAEWLIAYAVYLMPSK